MRTTINLPDGLAEAAKRKATAEGRTFTSLVEEGLRLVTDTSPSQREVKPLPSFGTAGGAILVDLDDRHALWDALDSTDEGR